MNILENMSMQKTKAISEKAIFAQPEKVKKYTDGKVIFEAYLQEANETNQNKRVYYKNTLDAGMRRIQDKIDRRAFVGELDHPISDNQIRQVTVMYKEASHLIREWGWEGNLLRGVIETLPYSANGKTLSGLILDRIPVGFSLRGLADVEDRGSFQEVKDPLLIITFDSVSEPSHSKATIQEIRNESFVRVLSESREMICCSNGHCYLPDYFDMLVESEILKLQKYTS